MAGTGLTTAILARLNEIVFAGSGAPLPPDFTILPTFEAHFWLALILASCIALHVLAAIYHEFVRHDRLSPRMWFGRRAPGSVAPME
jgi:cytochrome b561